MLEDDAEDTRLRPRLTLWFAARLAPTHMNGTSPTVLAEQVLAELGIPSDKGNGRDRQANLDALFEAAERCAVALERGDDPPGAARSLVRREAPAPDLARTCRAFARLPARERDALRIRRLESRSFAEVASVVGCAESEAVLLYCRALRAVARTLQEETS